MSSQVITHLLVATHQCYCLSCSLEEESCKFQFKIFSLVFQFTVFKSLIVSFVLEVSISRRSKTTLTYLLDVWTF